MHVTAQSTRPIRTKCRLMATTLVCVVAATAWAEQKEPYGEDYPVVVVPGTSTPSPTPTPTPAPAAVPTAPAGRSLRLGVNVTSSVYYNTERVFANLAQASSPWKDPSAGWGTMVASKLNSYGYPIIAGAMPISVPQPVWAGTAVTVTCTWLGSGTVRIDGDARAAGAYNRVSFTWPGKTGTNLPNIVVFVSGANASAPFRGLDCREAGLIVNGEFDQRFVNDMKVFGVLRFLDWSNTNGNPASVTWANRSTLDKAGTDGTALEREINLANAASSDPWFTVPYNADETYIRNMGKLVHDRLAPGRRAYFELSNEVWNYSFPVATQALNEGIAEKLSTDKYSNGLMRYAEKSIWMHKFLTTAFADNPARLVRVVSAQNDNSFSARTIMGFRDTANWVDALATAPYFGHSFYSGANAYATDLSKLFVSLEAMRVSTLAKARENKAIADKYGKRYVAYEAGQHVIAPAAKATLDTALQRSPLMYDIYKRYIADWKAQMGDTMTLYSATGTISQYGSWGMREYAGQSLAETPKRRAVLESISTQ